MFCFARNSLRISTYHRIDWDLPTQREERVKRDLEEYPKLPFFKQTSALQWTHGKKRSWQIYVRNFSTNWQSKFPTSLLVYYSNYPLLRWESEITPEIAILEPYITKAFSVFEFSVVNEFDEKRGFLHPYGNLASPSLFQWRKFKNLTFFFLRQGVPKVDDYSKPCVNLGEFHKNPPKFRIFDILNQFLVDIFDIFRHFLSFLEGELCQQIYEESDRTARHVWIWRGFGIAWNRKSEVWVYEAIGVWESKIHGKGSFSKGKFQPWGCDWFDRAVERVQKSRFDVWMCKSPPSVWIRLH